jgi:hypothetical protein
MMTKTCHLNLLMDSERVSSSPVRLRIMLPTAAILVSVSMAIWWLILTGQDILAKTQMSNLRDDMERHQAENAKAIADAEMADELQSQLEQLEGYGESCKRRWSETLASLAEVMPLKVQLTKFEIPAPPPQVLSFVTVQKGKKRTVKLWGPTNKTESVSMVIAGRTPKETPVISLMESLEGDAFTNSIVIAKDPRNPNPSPKVRSFRQDIPQRGEGSRMLAFEIEYTAKERRFAK